jgi:hypothetical protein
MLDELAGELISAHVLPIPQEDPRVWRWECVLLLSARRVVQAEGDSPDAAVRAAVAGLTERV